MSASKPSNDKGFRPITPLPYGTTQHPRFLT